MAASLLFVMSAGLAWNLASGLEVARPEGFDPFRYEYFAREGLSEESLLVTGYRIVILMQWLYGHTPPFWGFVMFCALLHAILAWAVKERALLVALFGPITFYYIGQTGKDGIAILAFIATAMLAIGRHGPGRNVIGLLIIALAIVIRPPVAAFLVSILVLYRYGIRPALAVSLMLGAGYALISDQAVVAEGLFGLVSRDDEADVTQAARGITFGTSPEVILIRMLLYLFSIFFQPVVGAAKFLSQGDFFLLFETLSYAAMLVYVLKRRWLKKFIIASSPFVIVVAIIFPFYHFRYLVVTYPVVLGYLTWTAQKRQRRERLTPLAGSNHASAFVP
jgi:hypothetical protein